MSWLFVLLLKRKHDKKSVWKNLALLGCLELLLSSFCGNVQVLFSFFRFFSLTACILPIRRNRSSSEEAIK